MSEFLEGLFGVGARAAIANQDIQNVESLGNQALQSAQDLGASITEGAGFKPYTVTSGTGQVDMLGSDGRFSGLNMTLGADQQALSGALQNAAMANADMAGMDSAARATDLAGMLGIDLNRPQTSEQDIFNMLSGVSEGERERERLALEQRLFNQGRTGVRTDAFGGTPEQLALAKAQEEARRGYAVDAYGLARAEEDRRFNQATGLFDRALQERGMSGELAGALTGSSFIPMDDLRRTASLGADIGSIDQQGRTEAARIQAGLTESGLEAQQNANEIAMQGRIARNNALANMILGNVDSSGNTTGGLLGDLFDKIF